ncbi:MAG: DNA polymerase IV [Lachnospiraceae bacterium]|nr:DNA polymerase IV [Lachnospiraceae bacterium]
MQERVIFHIDVNSAFLSWEAVERLKNGESTDLREIPAAVCGDRETRHGVILAKSIPAKRYGVTTGEPVVDALRKCPTLTLVSSNHAMYKEKSRAFMDILRQYSDVIEQFSIDEAFVDMTGTKRLFGVPEEAAARMKEQIRNELGFTVNVGISSNKLLAKMASDFKKPDRVHTLFPEEIATKMWPLPVRDLFFVGKAAEKKLYGMGIRTIGDLAQADPQALTHVLKKQGEVLWRYANGLDDSPVETESPDAKGYSNSITVPMDITESGEAKKVLLSLTENVCRRLRQDEVRVETVTVQIRFNDLTRASHQCPLPAATNITQEIYDNVCRLFEEMWDGTPIRLLGVSTAKVTREAQGRQMSLFDSTDYEKLEKLDSAMDSIRSRFGAGAVQRASSLQMQQEKKKGEKQEK